MKSDPKKQYSNIKTISGFPAGEAGYDLGYIALAGGSLVESERHVRLA